MIEHTIYNPASQSPDSLIENFVVRNKVFETIFNELKNSTTKNGSTCHYLIQGQRGMGKTTLLLRLKYEVENTKSLNWVVPVFFNEESYDLTSLSSLWEKLLGYLDELWDTGGEYYDHTEEFVEQEDYEQKCLDYLKGILKAQGKKIIIFFDNFTQLFLDNLKDRDKKRLESILKECDFMRIIGASAIVVTDAKNQRAPIFDLFKIVPLEGLSKDETFELLRNLSEKGDIKIDFQKNKAKLETLAILTGGVIRTLMLVYEVILADQDGSALEDLQMVLDRVTPLYKHRIEDLPLQQRKIIDIVAKRWDAVSTKEIASSLREDGRSVSTKLISAQLQQLEKNNVIDKKETATKNHLYQLKERFFNIWYLMRHGDRRDKRKVMWLTRFLELWYDDEKGFEEFLKRHIGLLKSGKYNPKSALLLSEALASSERLDVLSLHRVITATAEVLDEEQLKALPDLTNKILTSSLDFFSLNDYSKSIEILQTLNKQDTARDILIAWNYSKMGHSEKALEIAEQAVVKTVREHMLLATLYNMEKRNEQAIAIIDKMDVGKQTIYYKFKGEAYQAFGNNEKAKEQYRLAINAGNDNAVSSLFALYIEEGNFQQAETFIIEQADRNNNFFLPLLDFYLMGGGDRRQTEKARELIIKIDHKMSGNPGFLVYKGISKVFDLMEKDQFNGDFNEGTKHLEQAKRIFQKQESMAPEFELACSMLILIYTSIDIDKRKAQKLVAEKVIQGSYSNYFELKSLFLKVWDGKFDEAEAELLANYARYDLIAGRELDIFNDVILLLLAKEQFDITERLFNKIQNLQDILKPTYFAMLSLTRKKKTNEYIKMGRELEEPVTEILEKIKDMKKDYK